MHSNAHLIEQSQDSSPPNRSFSPLKLLATLIFVIFLAETIAMVFLHYLKVPNYVANTLLDLMIMLSLIAPGLYFFQLKPLWDRMEERAQAEHSLRTSETHLKRVMEALPVGVGILDKDGKLVHGNPAGRQIWAGIRFVSMQQYSEYKAWRADTGERIQSGDWASIKAVTQGTATLNEEINIEAFDGTRKTILNSVVPILDEQGQIQGAVVVNQDITSLKRAQQDLEERERLFRTAMQNLPVGVWLTDGSGKIVYANPAGENIWGGARFVGKEGYGEYKGWWLSTGKRIAPEEWAVARAIDKGETSLNEEVEIECFDGNRKIILNSAVPVRDDQGHILWAFIVNQDITERKQREQALTQTNELLERLFSSISTHIAYMDRDFNFIRVNQAYAEAGGYPLEFFLGKNYFDLYPHHENEAIFRSVLDSGEPFTAFVKPFEYPEFPERGTTYWNWSLQPVKGANGDIQGVLLTQVDVTERKRAELQLECQNEELLALSNAERKQRQMAESLVQSTIALSSSLKLEEVLAAILEQIQRAIPFTAAEIALLEDEMLRVVGFLGPQAHPEILEAVKRPFPMESIPLWVDAYSTLQPGFVADTRVSPDWEAVPGMEWVRSYAGAPLIAAGRVIGFINVSSDQPGCFDGETSARLAAFAVPAALAIQNARLYMAESKARRFAETLSDAAQALSRTLDLEAVIHTLLDHILVVVNSDIVGISLMEDEKRLALHTVRWSENWGGGENIPVFPIDDITGSVRRRIIDAPKSMVIPKMVHSTESGQPVSETARSWLLVPIIASSKFIGMLQLGRVEDEKFSPELVQFAEALVGQAAVAIQNAWLFQQVSASSERLQSLTRRLVEIQENERAYIARELHDETGQALSLLKLSLGRLEQDPECTQTIRQRLEDLKGVTDGLLEDLHRLAVDLRPAALDHLGLVAAVEQHAKNLRSDHLAVKLKAYGFEEKRLSKDVEINLYRIVQEALSNVVRHANASSAGILLEREGSRVKVFVEDDGVGFEPDSPKNRDSMGLAGMRERAEMMGGRMTVESSPGKGTAVVVEVVDAHSNIDRR